MKTNSLFIFLFATLFLPSCKFWKAKKKPLELPAIQTIASPDSLCSDSLFGEIRQANVWPEWLTAKVDLEVDFDGKSNRAVASVRLKLDSAIWLSISPMAGFEVARAFITRDSVKFYNRINNTYFKGEYDYIKQLLKIDTNFDLAQAIILGNLYLHYPPDQYACSLENGYEMLSSLTKRKIKKQLDVPIPDILFQEVYFNPNIKKIARVFVQDFRPVRRVDVVYLRHEDVDGFRLPASMGIKASADKVVEIQLQFSKIVLNKATNLPFSIPDNYDPIR